MVEKSDLLRWLVLLSFSMISIIIIIFPYLDPNSIAYAIITEIWIAIGITMIVYYFSKKTEEDNKNTLENIEKMVRTPFVENQRLRNEARFKIIHDFRKILEISKSIIQNAKKWEDEKSKNELDRLKELILQDYAKLSSEIINLESKEVVSTDFFSFYEIQHIGLIVEQCKLRIIFDDQNKICNYYHLNSLQVFLPMIIKKYEKEMSVDI